jgi:Prephenate dehydratase
MRKSSLTTLIHVLVWLYHYSEVLAAPLIHRHAEANGGNFPKISRPFTASSSSPLLKTRGGAYSGAMNDDDENTSGSAMIRVAYQGEPGAYSEKATRELLGPNVFAVGRPSFEAAFRAVASMEVDYACLPIENSLGGSIHENYDLMLRYQLCVSHIADPMVAASTYFYVHFDSSVLSFSEQSLENTSSGSNIVSSPSLV